VRPAALISSPRSLRQTKSSQAENRARSGFQLPANPALLVWPQSQMESTKGWRGVGAQQPPAGSRE